MPTRLCYCMWVLTAVFFPSKTQGMIWLMWGQGLGEACVCIIAFRLPPYSQQGIIFTEGLKDGRFLYMLGRILIQSRLCYIIGPCICTLDQLIQWHFFVRDWLSQIQQTTGKTCSVYWHMIGHCPCQRLGSRVIFTTVKGWQFGWSNR